MTAGVPAVVVEDDADSVGTVVVVAVDGADGASTEVVDGASTEVADGASTGVEVVAVVAADPLEVELAQEPLQLLKERGFPLIRTFTYIVRICMIY